MTPADELDVPRIDLAAVGESMVMLTPDPPVSLVDASSVAIHVGGAESNVATYLAELGYNAQWASLLGDDPFAKIILRKLSASGVDVGRVEVVAGTRTGVYVKDPAEGRTAVHYFRHLSAATQLAPDFLARALDFPARVLHLSGVTAALSNSALDMLREALREPGRYAEMRSFDVNYRPGLWSVGQAAPVLAELANHSDVVFVGLDEANLLWGCRTAEELRDVIPAVPRVIVKDGAVGAYAIGPRGVVFEPSLRVEVVEPIGAGDAFAAGYLAAALDDCEEPQRLRTGHLLASAALRVSSDLGPVPPHAELALRREVTSEEWVQMRVEHLGDGVIRTGAES